MRSELMPGENCQKRCDLYGSGAVSVHHTDMLPTGPHRSHHHNISHTEHGADLIPGLSLCLLSRAASASATASPAPSASSAFAHKLHQESQRGRHTARRQAGDTPGPHAQPPSSHSLTTTVLAVLPPSPVSSRQCHGRSAQTRGLASGSMLVLPEVVVVLVV